MKSNKLTLTIILLLVVVGATFWMTRNPSSSLLAKEGFPEWIEPDSIEAIDRRTRADFSLTEDEALQAIREDFPETTLQDIRDYLALGYMEGKVIDDTLKIHRKSPRNLKLLNPEMNGGKKPRGASASAQRMAYADSVIKFTEGENRLGGAHEVTYSFSIEVPYLKALRGDSLRVWMPYPMETARQSDIELLATSQPDYILSGNHSPHSTIYMSAPAPRQYGDTARFEYTARFITRGQYFSPEEIESALRPYDISSDIYQKYTAPEAPHIVRLDSLAQAIVGDETNPFRQSELVYDYIVERYPWAGAREYSTIECIPEYVIREGHGDCGQVALLYISLMRSLGVPARWESGWMLHPGEKNLHDWAEVYFEGVGWVPVDVSFGRYSGSNDEKIEHFYSHGMDAHRFATNLGIGSPLFPRKRFVRSETVDFQLGEVECDHGNIFYPGWSQTFKIIDIHPIHSDKNTDKE